MQKTLLYRLFGIGGIPKKLRPVLETEQIVVSDEGVGGWYITKDFTAPGKRSINRKEGFSGCLAVTKKRLICYTYGKRQINISVDDPKISAFYVEIVKPQTMAVSFESSLFHDDWKGVITLLFKTEKAQEFYDALISVGVKQGTPAARKSRVAEF